MNGEAKKSSQVQVARDKKGEKRFHSHRDASGLKLFGSSSSEVLNRSFCSGIDRVVASESGLEREGRRGTDQ